MPGAGPWPALSVLITPGLRKPWEEAVMGEAVSTDYCQHPQPDAIPPDIATGNLPPFIASCTITALLIISE
ncbi:hypothetical protein DUI87_05449 [Hirundo rustica rustica]|uniref:Uncharacterized protein n=1 Tax=Hirundo rustica rustica TaxID=333673 RepID=A0A3M0L210_HIRRU|nr:hypothetical protein DUI87_05449 [Hirundo rustica rustica]